MNFVRLHPRILRILFLEFNAWLILLMLGALFSGPARCAAQAGQQVQDPPSALIPVCSHSPYTPVPPPPPDQIEVALNQRHRYRLVIGAGEYATDPTMNRSFVDPTAALVDARLAAIGFKALPSLASTTPYLSGKAATKQAIMQALKEMVAVTNGQDYGVIYYIGHGSITLSNNDLTLGVYDRPVARDDGIRVSDILGTLEYGDWRSDITEIPHYLIVLDACFSGNSAIGDSVELRTQNNVQRLEEIQNQIVPPQIAILAATSDGDSSSAYPLRGTNASAFGYYFARALKEDWACADSITPDGILTLNELTDYLKIRLQLAYTQQYIEAPMVPTILNKDMNAFIAYDPSKHVIDGLRSEIVQVEFQPIQAGRTVTVTLPSGANLGCTDGCTSQISRSLAGKITIRSVARGFSVKMGNLDVQNLIKEKQALIVGVTARIQ
jgi:hypothetical protein